MRRLLFTVFLLCAPTYAALLGTSVTGSLQFGSGPSNLFDPVYGFVPASYLNSSGMTVTVSGSAVEFGFDDGANLFTANFTDNQLTVSDLVEANGSNLPFTMTFTDNAFTGLSVAAVSDTFPLAYSLNGNVLTMRGPGMTVTTGQTFAAMLSITPAPEPSTIGLLLISGLLISFFVGIGTKREKKT